MKTLKFVNKEKGQFTATLRKNVNNYFKEKGISTKGNTELYVKSLVMLSMYLVPFFVILFAPISGWMIFPLAVIMGAGMAGIGMNVMHDAVHGSFSRLSWLNKILGSTMYTIGGNVFNWKVQHNINHHTYTNVGGFDEDIEAMPWLRLSKHTPLKKMHKFQYIYALFLYCFLTLSKIVSEFTQLIAYNKAGITRQQGSTPRKEMTILILTKVAYLTVFLVLPLLVSDLNWWLIVLGFIVMHFVAGLIMSVVFQMAHLVEEVEQPVANEQNAIENEWTVHELETTANFSRRSGWFGWLIGGLNYQVEHHLFPNISHVHYRAISPIVEQTAKEFGVRYIENRTFFGAIYSHLRMLRTLGQPQAV